MDLSRENQKFSEFKEKNPDRNIVLIYGNCHMTALRCLLEQYAPFTERYAVYPIKAIQEVKDEPAYFTQQCFSECDVFIHQSIQLNNRYGKEFASESIMKQLKTSCKIISVPNVYHLPMCFFPQYEEKPEWKYEDNNTAFFRDAILDNVYARRGSADSAVKLYHQPDFYSSEHLDELFSVFIRKVRDRERDWDIKCSDFILENYKTTRLFYDPNHPTPFFIAHLAKQLMSYMGIDSNEEALLSIPPLRLNTYEMPICESVYSHFGMSFERLNIRDDKTGFNNNLNLKKYVKRYWLFEWQNEAIPDKLRKKSKTQYQVICYARKISRLLR